MSVIEAPTKTDESAYQAVLRGADLLDQHLGPNWEDRVDLDRLNIRDPKLCVLGQLMGSWGRGVEALDIRYSGRYGFNAARGTEEAAMAEAWERVLGERAQAREGSE